ncbi:unnamed protein product [Dibothriocephalus latus]|uniref:EB domain-containing protein n=1 Tax=Dibothriocephalus latus TaxID=60516 RepID=A0A3P6V0U6_DIBLA|nr:unnamed protein product [Dibothriocephalus latus]
MRAGILWPLSALELNILLVLSVASSSSAIQRMSAVNCQLLGDSVCSSLFGNSYCDRRKGECQCATNFLLISDGNDKLACNEGK